VTGQAQPLKNNPTSFAPHEQDPLYCQKYWDVCLLTHMNFNGIPVLVCRVQYTSPLFYSPVAACFILLYPTLCIPLSDVRLGCSCSAMETHSMKLSTHCCCANLKAT
ncbi:unnamed protein product, partial [Staurois parvus]